jgi:hypothetical protein
MEEVGKKVNKLSLAMLQMKGRFSLLMIPGARSAEKSIYKLLGWRGPKKKHPIRRGSYSPMAGLAPDRDT